MSFVFIFEPKAIWKNELEKSLLLIDQIWL